MLTRICISVFVLLTLNSYAQDSKNSSENIENQIDAIISQMSPKEKVGQTCQITLDVLLARDSSGALIEPAQIDPKKLQIALVDYGVGSVLNVGWHTLRLEDWDHIMEMVHQPFESNKTFAPIIYGIDAIHGINYTVGATLFPQEIGLAATWNPKLAMEFGEITAYETRASGIHWNFSPVLDIARQPLWSRTFETLGEDAYLASTMGKAIICGYQGDGSISPTHVIACMKHFVGYSAPESGRDRTPAWITDKQMNEIYFPTFKTAVEQGALSVMINSGIVNGVPGHINHHLLTEVLKEEWGFEGFAVSDWEDFIMLHTIHKVAPDMKTAITMAINAGVDMSMVPNAPDYETYCKLMLEAVEDGSIPQDRLDDAVRRILRVKFRAGLFEKNQNQLKKYPNFGSQEFKNKAEQAALESITLLKNDSNILPLSPTKKVLISGPTSDNLIFLNGAWTHTWQGDNPTFNTEGCLSVKEAFQERLGKDNCLFSQGAKLFVENGFETSALTDTADFKKKAEQSDYIILCLGEFPSTEKPGDIKSLNLPQAQIDLAKIAYRTGKPVVLILLEGRPRIIRPIVEQANGIIQGYLPGDYGANALVKLVYGDENFSGKLPYTYPKYDGVLEFYDHPRSVDRSKGPEFDAYDPQWDFGFGLNYSEIEYSDLKLDQTEISDNDSIMVSITIKNMGEMDAKEIVQMYISDHYASLTPAGKQLKAFTKTALDSGETKVINFVVSEEDLRFYDNHGEWISESGTFSIKIGGLEKTFELKK